MTKAENILRKRLLNQILVSAIIAVTLLIISYFIVYPTTSHLMIEDRKQSTKDIVTSIYNLLDGLNNDVKKGAITLEQAQAFAISNIKLQLHSYQEVINSKSMSFS